MGKTLVYIQSIPRGTATKISNWNNFESSGKPLHKTKIGRCTDKIRAMYSPKVGGLNTGLTEPWIENGEQVTDKESGKPLLLQHKIERQFNLPEGYLTNEMPGPNEKPTTYFQTKGWKLNDGSTVLDLSTLDGVCGYHVMLASSRVANSQKEMRSHKWPKAQWYIADTQESEEIKYTKNRQKSKAFAELESDKLTPSIKAKICAILDLASAKTTLTEEQSTNLLYDYIENSGTGPVSNIDKFMELTSSLKNKASREEFEAKYLLKKALDYRVVYEKQSTYTWTRPSGSIELGSTYTEAIEFLLNPKKQALIEELEEEIKAKAIT